MIHKWLRMLRGIETESKAEFICALEEGPILGVDGSDEEKVMSDDVEQSLRTIVQAEKEIEQPESYEYIGMEIEEQVEKAEEKMMSNLKGLMLHKKEMLATTRETSRSLVFTRLNMWITRLSSSVFQCTYSSISHQTRLHRT